MLSVNPFTITYVGIEKSKKTNVKLIIASDISIIHERVTSIKALRLSFAVTPIANMVGIAIVTNAPMVITH